MLREEQGRESFDRVPAEVEKLREASVREAADADWKIVAADRLRRCGGPHSLVSR